MTKLASLFTIAPVALGLLLGGCGDDSSTDDGATPGSTSNAPATDDSTGDAPGSTGAATETGDPGTTDGGDSTTDGGDSTTDAPTGDSSGAAGLEIAGDWLEDLGDGSVIEHAVDVTQWSQSGPFGDSLYHVDSYDNAGMWLVAQGDSSNEFFPDLYNKFNWTWDGDTLYYCTVVFDAATPEDAMMAPDADPGDLASGCGGFPWSVLMAAG